MLSRRVLLPSFAGLFAGVTRSAGATPQSGVWVGSEHPPFLRHGLRGPEGYAYELFQRVHQQAGLKAELRFFPWARALRMVQGGDAQAVLVMARSPEREAQFHWLFPIGSIQFAAFSRSADAPVPSDFNALKGRRIGSLRASASRYMLSSAGFPDVVEAKDYAELLALLRRGVVDVIISPEAALTQGPALESSSGDLRRTVLGIRRDLYAGAGPAMPEDVRRRLVAAYQQLLETGVVAQLRKRHPEVLFVD